MEINKIIIHNFQAIKHLEVDLVDGINCLIGTTHSGKSACIRALNWLFFNDFCDPTWETKETFVEVHFTDGNIVKRLKSTSTNCYFLNNEKFTAIGKNTVPAEIEKVLNVSEINLKNQEDPQFLVNCSDGERARAFNSIIHLEKIEKATRIINQKYKKIKNELDANDIIILSRQKELEKLVDLSQIENMFNEYEELQEKRENLSSELLKIKNSVETITELKSSLVVLKNYKEISGKLEEYKEISEKINEKKKESSILLNLVNELHKCEIIENVNLDEVCLLKDELKGIWEKQEECSEKLKKLKETYEKTKSVKNQLDEIVLKIKETENKREIWKKSNPICPTCGKEW